MRIPYHSTSVRPNTIVYRQRKSKGIPVALYDSAMTHYAYGHRSAQMGDLFNDIVGAVVPGWDKRPDWMKKVQVKPDPARLMQAASRVVPPKQIGNLTRQANRYGFDFFYKTPAGNMPMTPEMMESAYSNYPTFARLSQGLSAIPWWVYAVGAGGAVLFFTMKRK